MPLMASDIDWIEPSRIKPLHDVRNQRILDELVASMLDQGWNGRPLLVIQRGANYFAWTGSHRIAAAKEAGLQAVPCYVLQENRLPVTADYGHVEDYERLKILSEIGDETAIHIMWQEGRV